MRMFVLKLFSATAFVACILSLLPTFSNAQKKVFSPRGNTESTAIRLTSLQKVSLRDMLFLRARPDSLVIDLRSRATFDRGHIPNSISAPLGDSAALEGILQRIPSEFRNIIMYGATADELQTYLAKKREIAPNMKLYEGGWAEWLACALPVSR